MMEIKVPGMKKEPNCGILDLIIMWSTDTNSKGLVQPWIMKK